MNAPFITFEGGEGAGKSTQIQLLADTLIKTGCEVALTREPGGTKGAQSIRELLVSGQADKWLPLSELLLLYAARLDHVERLIKPRLKQNCWVLCDRFADSTLAYQGYGMGIELQLIKQIHEVTLGTFKPDLTFIFDLDPEIGLARAASRDVISQRYETMDVKFHQIIRNGFLEIARLEPERCVVIDADQSPSDISKLIRLEITRRYGLGRA